MTTSVSRSIRVTGSDTARIWGLTAFERLERIGRKLGITDLAMWPGSVPPEGVTLIVASHVLLEDRLIAALLDNPGIALKSGPHIVAISTVTERLSEAARIVEDGQVPASGWTVETAEAPRFAYNAVLRKRAVPFVLDTRTTKRRDIEWRMFGASYKGATDFVTKWLWPVPAFHATRLCAALGLSPNFVTLISLILVFAAMALFSRGDFGVGIAAAWAMTFLDTVDGKLARVTVTSSAWGNAFDHGIDMIHPPFWYWAWAVGLGAAAPETRDLELWIIVGGYVLGRVIEGAFIALFKFEMHVWQPFDFWLRTITARRNPNLAILMAGALSGAPALAFKIVAIWTVICLAIHTFRLIQAIAVRGSGTVASFLEAKNA